MKPKQLFIAGSCSSILIALFGGMAQAADLYIADFSEAGVGSTHDTGADTLEISPIDGENWSIFWNVDPSSDGSTNRFITEDGLLVSEDWGGEAFFETEDIDVSGETTINIEAVASTRGVDVFNNIGTEFFSWYYILDGTRTDEAQIVSDGSLDYSKELDVTGISTLAVGFAYNVNGAGDGFEIVSLKVNDGVPTPEIDLVLAPPSIDENGGTSTVTVNLSAAPVGNLVLDLAVDDLSEATVPATVTVLSGALSATFQITGQNDAEADGPQIVNLTVTDPGGLYSEGAVSFVVTDDEPFTAPSVVINEIRINSNNAFTGDGEYFELFSSQTNASLDRVFLVAIGDGTSAQGSGVVEEIIDLSGQTMNGSFFVAADPEQNLVTGEDLSVSLNFEDDNVTFLLVSDFAAVLGDDLDADDDGTLDLTPWGALLDAVSLVSSESPTDPGDLVYAGTLVPAKPVVGPDSTFIPAHVYRTSSNPFNWQIGTFFADDVEAADTPGVVNPGGGEPPAGDLVVTGFTINRATGVGSLSATGLGALILVVESSTDLGQSDAWAPLANPASEVDNPDGSVSFNFTDPEAVGTGKIFYRLADAP